MGTFTEGTEKLGKNELFMFADILPGYCMILKILTDNFKVIHMNLSEMNVLYN